MADEIASLKVVIEAEDKVSPVVDGIGEKLGGLGGKRSPATRVPDEIAQKWQATGKALKNVGEGIDSVTKPIQVASVALAAGGTAAAKFAIDFEDNFAAVKKTVDGTPEQLAEIRQGIIDLTTTGINGHSAIPMTTQELTELAAAGGQLGIQTENIVEFTETMAQLGTATNLVGEEGAQTLARFMNVTGTSQGDIDRLGSAIVDLGNNYATTEAEIAQMALRLGATASVVGFSTQDILAYSTALSSMGVEAEAGGSAVSRIIMDIQSAVSSGGQDLQNFAKTSGKTAEEFAEQWKTDASGAFEEFIKGLSQSEDIIGTLADLGFNNIRDIQALQRFASASGIELLTSALERSNTAWQENTALQTEFDAKADTTASKIQIVKNNLTEAGRSLGEVMLPTIADATSGIANFAQGLAKMDEGSKKTAVGIGAVTVGVGALSKVAAGGMKFVGNIAEGIGKISEAASSLSSFGFSGGALAELGTLAGGIAAPAGVIAGYHLISKYVGESIENNSKLGQSYKELYGDLQEAEKQAEHIGALRDEYDKLNQSIEQGELSGDELEKAKARTEEIVQEIKGLVNDDTIKLMIDTGDYEAALDLAVAEAKNAVNEIEDTLSADNYKDAKKAVSGAYDTLIMSGNEGAQYRERQTAAREWLKEAAEFEQEYSRIMDNLSKAEDNGNSKGMRTFNAERNRLIKEMQDSGFTEAYKQMTGNDFKFEDMDGVVTQIQNVKTAYSELSTQIGAADETAENSRKSLAAMAQTAQDSAIAFNGFNNIQDVFAAGGNAVNNTVTQLISNMREWGFENKDIAAQVALFLNGFSDLQGAIEANALDAVISNFISKGEQLGLTSGEIAEKAALMKNGFSDIQQAAASGKINAVVSDFAKFGESMGMTVEQVDALAHGLELVPENKHIELTANGFEILDGAAEKLKEFANENVHISVDADGNLTILDEATGKTQILQDIGAVNLAVNAEGNIEALDAAGEKVAEIDGETAEVTYTANTDEADQYTPDDKPADVVFHPNTEEVDAYQPDDKSADVIYHIKTVGTPPKQQATGTDNFPGGLAMVNDQTGVADPRELILDHGRAFIPQGRNVILPLSKGAKVYTASQTKAIMTGMGIPRYAEGKDNSDAFTSARDDWLHYTRTHAVTVLEEYEKWLEFQEKFKDNEKDIQDIEEQLFSYRQKMYSERVNASESWLDHEERYNGLAASDYIAGLDRMKQYMAEYYAEGIISREEYNEQILRLDEKRIDKEREMLKKQQDESLAWIGDRTYFNDWQNYGDTPEAAYGRVKERLDTALAEGKILWDDYNDYLSEAGSALYQGRREQSESWLEEQRKYFGMSAEDYVAGLEREKAYTEEYYRLRLISAREYHEGMTEINHQIWDEAASAYDDMLSKQSEYISDMREKFSDEEQALRDSWDTLDRDEDMDDVRRQLEIYAGAVTDRGQQKYKDLQEQLKQLERDEELYQLQVNNNAVLERLEAEYDRAEDAKADFLKSIAVNTDIDVSGIVGDLTERLTTTGGNIETLLTQLLEAVNNSSVPSSTVYGPTYNDNRKISLTQIAGLIPLLGETQ